MRRAVLLLALLSALLISATTAGNVSLAAEGETLALGARIEGAPNDPAKIDEFSAMVGAKPPVVMWFASWAYCAPYSTTLNEGCFSTQEMDAVASRGATPMVTWQPWDPRLEGQAQPLFALKTITNGEHDAYIRKWAQDAKGWGKPMYLRFAHEMNGTWYPWSPGLNGNTASQYVAAWKHVHGIFHQEGATNVKWVWSPYVDCSGCAPFSSVYPGDPYVDWVALDGYNWGTTQPGMRWQSMAEVFGPSYDRVTALAPTKPFMIAEAASTEVGGDKAAWIRDGYLRGIPDRLPKTKAVIWFHRNKVTDWRVNSSAASLAAYKEVVASFVAPPPPPPPPAADTTKPTVTGMSPKHKSATRDVTPSIRAVVRDNATDLQKANVKLYVNGKRITRFSYSVATDKLVYNSPKIAKGKKTVKVVATDAAGNVRITSWYFTVK